MSPVSIWLFFLRSILWEWKTFSMLRTTSTHTFIYKSFFITSNISTFGNILFLLEHWIFLQMCFVIGFICSTFFFLAVSLNIHRHRFFRNLFIFLFFSKLYKSIEKNFLSFRLEINQAHLHGKSVRALFGITGFFQRSVNCDSKIDVEKTHHTRFAW